MRTLAGQAGFAQDLLQDMRHDYPAISMYPVIHAELQFDIKQSHDQYLRW